MQDIDKLIRHAQDAEIIALLWDYLPRDQDNKDRRRTGYGTKTQAGLIESVRRALSVQEAQS